MLQECKIWVFIYIRVYVTFVTLKGSIKSETVTYHVSKLVTYKRLYKNL